MDTDHDPAGEVAFLFTDVAGSTRLWDRWPAAMPPAWARHDAILRAAAERFGGTVFKVVGDGFQIAFHDVASALAAALDAQRALDTEAWPVPEPIRVRMAVHCGTVVRDATGDYRSPILNRLGRLLDLAHGGQILCSEAAAGRAGAGLPDDSHLVALGNHHLLDLDRLERVFELRHPARPVSFGPLRARSPGADAWSALPHPTNRLLGRDALLEAILKLLTHPPDRLVTLTGPGGIGKTRLARAVADDLAARPERPFPGGVWLVELAARDDPADVIRSIATTLGERADGDAGQFDAVATALSTLPTLLVLDNFEHLLPAAADIGRLLATAAPLTILVTSRSPLRVPGEHEVAVPLLALPPDPLADRSVAPPDAFQIASSPAVRLFVARAGAVRPGFAVTERSADTIAAICRRLDGLPLAIELAAARSRLLAPEDLLTRLDRSPAVLSGGGTDLPARHRTLLDTVAWSHTLLPSAHQTLFRQLAIFHGAFTFDAVEAVIAPPRADPPETEDEAALNDHADLIGDLEVLTEHSLIQLVPGTGVDEPPRMTMLETVRAYAAEQLDRAGERPRLAKSHARWCRTFAGAAATGLRGPDQIRWLGRVTATLDDLRAGMAWTLERGQTDTVLEIATGTWWF